MSREITNKFLDSVADGLFDNYDLIVAFSMFLSEDEMKEFLRINDLGISFDEEEEVNV